MTLTDAEKIAASLSRKERAVLALYLIETLEESDEGNLKELWLQEARQRIADFNKGKIKAIPAKEALTNARKNLS